MHPLRSIDTRLNAMRQAKSNAMHLKRLEKEKKYDQILAFASKAGYHPSAPSLSFQDSIRLANAQAEHSGDLLIKPTDKGTSILYLAPEHSNIKYDLMTPVRCFDSKTPRRGIALTTLSQKPHKLFKALEAADMYANLLSIIEHKENTDGQKYSEAKMGLCAAVGLLASLSAHPIYMPLIASTAGTAAYLFSDDMLAEMLTSYVKLKLSMSGVKAGASALEQIALEAAHREIGLGTEAYKPDPKFLENPYATLK